MTICGEGAGPPPRGAARMPARARPTWARPARIRGGEHLANELTAARRRGEESAASSPARRAVPKRIDRLDQTVGQADPAGRQQRRYLENMKLFGSSKICVIRKYSICPAGPILGRGVQTSAGANRVGKPAISPRAACIRGLSCASPRVCEATVGDDRDIISELDWRRCSRRWARTS